MNNHLNTTLTEIYRTIGRHARNSANPDAEDHFQDALIASLEHLESNSIRKTKAYIGTAYRRNFKRSKHTVAMHDLSDIEWKLASAEPTPEEQTITNALLHRIVREKNDINPLMPLRMLCGKETNTKLSSYQQKKASRLRKKIMKKIEIN